MKSLIIHLNGKVVQAAKLEEAANTLTFNQNEYVYENIYFGDWIPLKTFDGTIVGFKLVPFVKDSYLNERILNSGFIRSATNVIVEKIEQDTYISILLKPEVNFTADGMNHFEAAIFHNNQNDFVVRLDGFSEENWAHFDFPIKQYITVSA